MIPQTGIYAGHVLHRRVRPTPHALRYRAYWLLVELSQAGFVAKGGWLLRFDRRGLFAFHTRDHGDGSDTPLAQQVTRLLRDSGVAAEGCRVFLFAFPRLLGYVFNPLSIYFCYAQDGSLAAVVYEVHNTFGQRHTYVIPAAQTGAGPIRQTCEKAFYVSPFLPMQMRYDFTVVPPSASVTVGIAGRDRDGPLIATALRAQARPLTARNLLALFFTHPLMTLKVISAIHWEALLIWRKGIALVKRPPPPREPVSRGRAVPAGDTADAS